MGCGGAGAEHRRDCAGELVVVLQESLQKNLVAGATKNEYVFQRPYDRPKKSHAASKDVDIPVRRVCPPRVGLFTHATLQSGYKCEIK
jgi:hypothetical protein